MNENAQLTGQEGGGTAAQPDVGPDGLAQPARPGRWWSRGLVALIAAVTAGTVAVHLAMTFLYVAPSNPVSQAYSKQIDAWMLPLFQQDWNLFAPDPLSENVDIKARATVQPSDTVTDWIDLTAADRAAEVGDPVPSHVTLNGLRLAYVQYLDTHSAEGESTTPLGPIVQQYLENLVVDRLQGLGAGRITAVQLQITTTLLPGPGRTAAQTAPQTETFTWWTVS